MRRHLKSENFRNTFSLLSADATLAEVSTVCVFSISSIGSSQSEDAFSKFDVLERRADFAEGRAEALGMTGPKSLEEEIAEFRSSVKVDAELEALKAALKRKGD